MHPTSPRIGIEQFIVNTTSFYQIFNCSKCGRKGHMAQFCRQTIQTPRQPRSSEVCYDPASTSAPAVINIDALSGEELVSESRAPARRYADSRQPSCVGWPSSNLGPRDVCSAMPVTPHRELIHPARLNRGSQPCSHPSLPKEEATKHYRREIMEIIHRMEAVIESKFVRTPPEVVSHPPPRAARYR